MKILPFAATATLCICLGACGGGRHEPGLASAKAWDTPYQRVSPARLGESPVTPRTPRVQAGRSLEPDARMPGSMPMAMAGMGAVPEGGEWGGPIPLQDGVALAAGMATIDVHAAAMAAAAAEIPYVHGADEAGTPPMPPAPAAAAATDAAAACIPAPVDTPVAAPVAVAVAALEPAAEQQAVAVVAAVAVDPQRVEAWYERAGIEPAPRFGTVDAVAAFDPADSRWRDAAPQR